MVTEAAATRVSTYTAATNVSVLKDFTSTAPTPIPVSVSGKLIFVCT